jgi:hypothetical protein
MVKDISTQLVPALPGWLALFEYEVDGEVEVHAEPVIAWSLAAENGEAHHHAVGKAVIGASPWLEEADPETAGHLFMLVREEQLEPVYWKELTETAMRSRASILEQAQQHASDRHEGRATWLRHRHRPHVPA